MILADSTGLTAAETSRFHVNADTYRLLGTASYITWVAALVISAVVVWAASTAALRSAALPRWFGRLGILVGIAMLFGLLLFPFLFWWVWIVVASILLVRRPHAVTVPLAHATS
jgi:hypothetical protein